MQIGFVLDIIIAVLLVLTITYAVRLNQRLSQLRSDKNELQALAKTFADATSKAEDGIKQLKISSESLRSEVKKAEMLRDDLAYLVDRGGRTADQMVDSVRTTKRVDDDDFVEDEENRLIEEAIRAATPGAAGATGSGGRKAGGRAPAGRGAGPMAATTRRVSGHPEPATEPSLRAPRVEPRTLGGGLGGVTPKDRLLDEHKRDDDEPLTVGDSDAARELLKALSSVK